MKLSLSSNRKIWMMSVVIFSVVAAALLFSTYYMNISIVAEENAHTRRAEYKQLGENLADASDYLTAEVRYYAITGDIEHLYNYWEEIFETKQREKAILTFESSDSPAEERALLEQAKKYSDLLVETETCSMKLVLLSEGKNVGDYVYDDRLKEYVEYVMAYETGVETELKTPEEMRQKAIEILYDENYEDYKTKIMTPIEDFNGFMNARLDKEVEERKQGTRIATIVQVILAILSLFAIGFLLILKNAQESMQKARMEAELANQAKSTFMAHMSHELRTPLNAVNGYTYLLGQTALTPTQMQYLDGIHHSSNGLLELINQILDFSKIEAGHLQLENNLFSIRGLLQDVEAVFTQQAVQKNLKFEVEISEDAPDCIAGDSLRLRQVLLNLLGNAFKFTEKGSVSLSVSLLQKAEGSCLLHFVVADTGIGIEESVREKIFRPFVQSDVSVTRKYGGTGLGLPICNEIIMLSGDKSHRLELESEVGKGSVFSFSMDFPYQEQDMQPEIKAEVKIPHFGGRKVLITDDSEINIRVQSEILSLCGMITVSAESGMQAIDLLKEQKDIELIFMDIRMPQMDGYETTRRIRQLEGYENIPIVALTADAVPEVQQQITEAGMNDCLLKPVEQEALFQLLSRYLNESEESIFEPEDCLKQLNGNSTAMEEMIDCFLLLHKKDKELLENDLRESRFAQAEELVHQLKGITGNLKCTALYHCCCDLQKELQQNRTDSYELFKTLWDETIEILSSKQQEYMSLKKVPEQKKLDKKAYEKMLVMCEECDTEVLPMLEAYMEELQSRMPEEEYSQLKESMLRYHFGQIKKSLEQLGKFS